MRLIRTSSTPKTERSRADESRQRRAQTSQQSARRATRNVVQPASQPRVMVRPVQPPPITVRTPGSARTLNQKTRGKVRRQFYYSLGATGAEMRLPSVPMIRPGWRVLSGLLTLLLGAALYFAYNTPALQVSEVTYEGIKRVKAADIDEIIELQNLPIFMVDTEQVYTDLAKFFPDLKDVRVEVNLPARVSISVVERQPIMSWKTGEDTIWVDEDGFIFPARGKAKNLLVIEADAKPPLVVSAEELLATPEPAGSVKNAKETTTEEATLIAQTMDPQLIQAAQGLRKHVPDDAIIVHTAKSGLGWSDPAGWTVMIGMNLENIEMKMTVYEAIVAKLSQESIVPALISVENVHAPYYRLEQ